MSLLRLAFWLALLVLLLPTDEAQQARLISFATTALERLSTFCDRNARTCDAAAAAWGTFLRKAEFGVRLVGDLLGAGGRQRPDTGPDAPPDMPPPPEKRLDRRLDKRLDKRLGKADPRGTLSPSDLYDPPWRAPKRPKDD
jgi:hypothetical protein